MKDSQHHVGEYSDYSKYIKANNERFSTGCGRRSEGALSISRRIMKDSQLDEVYPLGVAKYIKANNERFSTSSIAPCVCT